MSLFCFCVPGENLRYSRFSDRLLGSLLDLERQ